jgi:ribulose-5-phosphate 4-epimerase/fuculose-1-phosphate aldolase
MTVSQSAPSGRSLLTDELQVRKDLAACYRLVAHFGWDDLVATHISARVPESDDILLNPYGFLFEEITASSLVRVSLHDDILSSNALDVNPAGFVIHSAIHMVRPDAGCVIHLHGRAGVAVSALECGLLPLNQKSMTIIDDIAYHEYEGPALNLEERVRLQADLGPKNIMVLRNHGSLVVGSTVASAFVRAYMFEWSCKLQLAALATGYPLNEPPADVILMTKQQVSGEFLAESDRSQLWAAMISKLDGMGSDFRA